MIEDEVAEYSKGDSQILVSNSWSKIVGNVLAAEGFDLNSDTETNVNVKVTTDDIKKEAEY